MAKPPSTVEVRIPPYQHPANDWRREIHATVIEERNRRGIIYSADDELELWVRFYFREPKVDFMDVDNRLKDVMDALQGCVGGGEDKKPELEPVVPNDSQVIRAVVEKSAPPPQSHGFGHLKIRKYSAGSRVILTWD